MEQCLLTGVVKSQQTLVKMSVIMILVVINNVIRCGYYSRRATIKGVATIQGGLLLKVWLVFSSMYIQAYKQVIQDVIMLKTKHFTVTQHTDVSLQ